MGLNDETIICLETAANFDDFKEKVAITCDKDFFNQGLSILFAFIKMACTTSDKYAKAVNKLFKYLKEADKKEVDFLSAIKVLDQIETKLLNNIHVLEEKKKPKTRQIAQIHNAISSIKDLRNTILHNNKTNYQGINEFVNYMISRESNPDFNEYVFNNYPSIIEFYNSSQGHLLIHLVDNYICCLDEGFNDKNRKKLLYLNQTIERLTKASRITISDEVMTEVLLKIEQFIDCFVGKKDKNRIISWIESLKLILEKKKINQDLKKRMYGIYETHDEGALRTLDYNSINIIRRSETPTEDLIMTIDNDDTNNRDDAFRVRKTKEGNYLLDLFTSNPLALFEYNSQFMRSILRRGNTIYLANAVYDLFPEEIIRNYLTLDSQKYRYARRFRHEYDKYGEEIDSSFSIDKGTIRVDRNLTYKEADKIINKGSNSRNLETSLINASELAALITKRNKYGINFDYEEGFFGHYDKTPSTEIIQRFIVFHGVYLAEFFRKKGLALAYRAQDRPRKFDETDPFAYIKVGLNKIPNHSYYTLEAKPHFSLGAPSYSHSSSPNRRGIDNINAHAIDMQIHQQLTDAEYYRFEQQLKRDVDSINQRNKEIIDFSYARCYPR